MAGSNPPAFLDAGRPERWGSVFRAARHRDLRQQGTSGGSLTEWTYLLRSRKSKEHDRFLRWEGPASIFNWAHGKFENFDTPIAQTSTEDQTHWRRPAYGNMEELIRESALTHQLLFRCVGTDIPSALNPRNKDIYNAQDFHYCASLVPDLRSVLEFGGGYGREIFLFRRLPHLRFFALDAVEQPYLLQYWVFSQLGIPLWEYLDHGEHADSRNIRDFIGQNDSGARIVHLPTWRADLIPERSLDLAMFVWCLSEMSEEAMRHALGTVRRALRPGGFVYIRDVPHQRSYPHNAERMLLNMGFKLVYYPWKHREDELHAVPRLYRLTGEKTWFAYHTGAIAHLKRTSSRTFMGTVARAIYRRIGRLI
jgi:SAM-dependent methyltransferase